MADTIGVYVVYAPAPGQEWLRQVRVAPGASVRTVIQASGIATGLSGFSVEQAEVGVWGRSRRLDDPVSDGDRVEVYRPLRVDPKAARARRADRKAAKKKPA